MNPQRILLISPFFPPQPSMASLRAHSFARAWVEAGDEVTVLTTAKRLDQTGLDLPCERVEVIEIEDQAPTVLEWVRSATRPPPPLSTRAEPAPPRRGIMALPRVTRERTGVFSAVRMPDLTDWWIEPVVKWCARATREWDVAVSCGGPYPAHLAAMALKRRRIVRHWVADFRDLWTQHPLYTGLFPWTIRERALERCVLREADLVTTVSEGLASRLRSRTDRTVQIVTNGYDPDAIDSLPKERVLPRDGVTRLVYTGSLYPRGQDASPLMRAMAYLRNNRPDEARRLRLIVAGSNAAHWARLADVQGVRPMLEFRGDVAWRDALRLQRDADALILVDWRDPDQGVLTGKLFEYLASVPPILVIGGAGNSAAAAIVHRAGRGRALGNDQGAIRHAIECLMRGEPLPFGHRDTTYIHQFMRHTQAMILRAAIDGLANCRPR